MMMDMSGEVTSIMRTKLCIAIWEARWLVQHFTACAEFGVGIRILDPSL